jgi:hypothetical protein
MDPHNPPRRKRQYYCMQLMLTPSCVLLHFIAHSGYRLAAAQFWLPTLSLCAAKPRRMTRLALAPGRLLSNNSFVCTLPPFTMRVEFLGARSNRLDGTISAVHENMLYLDLGINMLTGSVPSTSSSHSHIYLNVDDNRLSSLPSEFTAMYSLYLSAARNRLRGTLPDFGDYALSLVYCDLSGNMLSGNVADAAAGLQMWSYMALNDNMISGSLPKVWQGDAGVLLLQNNNIRGCLPECWDHNSSLTVLDLSNNTMACPAGLPLSWSSRDAFQNLLVLSLHSNKGLARTPVPSAWFASGSFHYFTNLQLGDLWTSSANSRQWRRQVCIQHNWHDRLQAKLVSGIDLDRPLLIAEQDIVDAVLAQLAREKRLPPGEYFNVPVDVDLVDVRLTKSSPPSLKDICGNPRAWQIVAVQWVVVGACLLGLFSAYAMERKWSMWSTLFQSAGGCLSATSNGASWFSNATGKLFALRHLMALVLYWFDIVMDVVLLHSVFSAGANLGYGLLVILVAHYVVLAQRVAWRCTAGSEWWWRVLATVLALPLALLMPLIDTVTFAVMATVSPKVPNSGHASREGSWEAELDDLSEGWLLLFETREVLEVCLEAIPTSVLQSVVFVVGNNPSLGVYLDETLYLLSSVGSSVQILRLTAGVLWAAAQQHRSAWNVLWGRLLVGSGAPPTPSSATPQQDRSEVLSSQRAADPVDVVAV